MSSVVARFFADVKGDKGQAVKESLLANSGLATAVHPVNGQTALQVAVQSAGESVIRSLRRHGARWTDVDNAGNNAVHYISRAGRAELCRTRKSADWVMALHQPNAAGDTPLHTTLSSSETATTADIIHAFVAVGADINRRNAEGRSALDLAEGRLHLVQTMHEAANSALGNVGTPSYSAMGAESSMVGTSFFAGPAASRTVIENGLYEGGSTSKQRAHDHGASNRSRDRLRTHTSSKKRSNSLSANMPSGAPLALSPARRSSSVVPEHAAGDLDKVGTAPASRVSGSRSGKALSVSGMQQGASSRHATRQQSTAAGRNEQEHLPQMQSVSMMGGGGSAWASLDHDDASAQPASPASSVRRKVTRTNSVMGGAGLRHPAPIRTSVHSNRQMAGPQSMPAYRGYPAASEQQRRDSTMVAAVDDGGTPLHTDNDLTPGASQLRGEASMHHVEYLQRSGSGRGRSVYERHGEVEDDGVQRAESPAQSRCSVSRHAQQRAGSNLARVGSSYSAMTPADYEGSSARREPPLAPAMRAHVRSLVSRDDSVKASSPRRAPPTPGSVRSMGTANASAKGEGSSLQDKVRQMQHALKKAASAMRQLQEDRKADAAELSDFAKCVDAMTERMDIMDQAMQKVVGEGTDLQNGRADFEARDDIEKLADSVAGLEGHTDDVKQWMRDTDEKLVECWAQIEYLVVSMRDARAGQASGLSGAMDAMEGTVADMKQEMKALREQQLQQEDASSRRQQSSRHDEAVLATLAELREELNSVREDQQRTKEQMPRALNALEGATGLGVGAAGTAAVAALSGGPSGDLKEAAQKAQAAKEAVDSMRGDVKHVQDAVVQVKAHVESANGNWEREAGRITEAHGEQKLLWGKLVETSSVLEKLQGAAVTAQAARQIAQEVSRGVAQDMIQGSVRDVAREVARETAMLAGAEAAQAAVQESASVREADISTLSPPSTPNMKRASPEVLERLRELEGKVDLLDDRVSDVAAGAKGLAGAAEMRGAACSSGGSYSPPRTPDAAAEAHEYTEKQNSMDMGSDASAGKAAEANAPEREVLASKAMLYTNIYSGPSQSAEISQFSLQLTEVQQVATAASIDILDLRGDLNKIKQRLNSTQEVQGAPAGPKTLGSGFDEDGPSAVFDARLKEIQGVALRADVAREETEETLGIMESRLDRAEHNIQLLQHAVHQHDERIANFMYSPSRNSIAEGSYALKSTVEALESKIMQVEVQYAGRLQAQKAKNDKQAALIQGLLERVSALEQRGGE